MKYEIVTYTPQNKTKTSPKKSTKRKAQPTSQIKLQSNAQTATFGGILLIASTIFIALVNYMLSITLSWLLTPAQYGTIGVSQSLIFVGSWFLIAGFPWVATQVLAKVKTEEIESTYPLLNSVLWANTLLGIAVAGSLWLAVRMKILPMGSEYQTLVHFVALVIIVLAVRLAITPVLQARLQFAQLSLVTTAEVLVQFVAAVALVYWGFGAVGALWGFAIGSAISLFVALWLTRHTRFWKLLSFDTTLLAQLRPAIPLLVANMSGVLLVNADILVLRFLISGHDELLGYYQVIAVLARIPYYLSQSANTIIFPLIARHSPESPEADQISRQALNLVLSLVVGLCLVLIAAPYATIAFFFPPVYLSVAPTLRLLALAIGLIILAQTLATIFQARNQSWLAARILPLAALVQIIAAFWLIPRYQLEGAALSSCIAGAVALIGMLLTLRRSFSNVIQLSGFNWWRQAGAFLLLGSVSAALPLLGRISTAIWIASALVLYLLALLWLRVLDPEAVPLLSSLRFPLGKMKR